jgi:thioesterase domain-containing protein
LGGNIAHAVAARLENLGERVGWLGLMDSSVPGPGSVPSLTSHDVHTYVAREGTLHVEPEDELCTALTRAANNNLDVVLRTPPPVFGRAASFFTADLDRPEGAPEPTAWKPYVAGGLMTHSIDCAHLDMTRPEPLGRIARIIETSLTGPGRPVRAMSAARSTGVENT